MYNSSFSLLSQVSTGSELSSDYTSAVTNGEDIYIGTKDFGVLKTAISASFLFEEIHPYGPLRNTLV